MIVLIIISVGVYYPFFKVYEKTHLQMKQNNKVADATFNMEKDEK